MPFQITSIESLMVFVPDEKFDPARDRLQVEFQNGERVILMYDNRSPYIKNPVRKLERFWLDHRRSPLNFSALWREQLAPRLDDHHAGLCASVALGHLFLQIVSQSYVGRLRSTSPITLVIPVLSTDHTAFTYDEIDPFEQSTRWTPVSA